MTTPNGSHGEPLVSSSGDSIEQEAGNDMCQWEGFWFTRDAVEAGIAFRSRYEARDDDVLLASTVKTGTTWLKSLCLTIMHMDEEGHVFMKGNGSPHFHVPSVESIARDPISFLSGMPSPRLFHTHLPYRVLPDSIKRNPKCKIVYIARNPKDTLVSFWHFVNTLFRPNQPPSPLEEAFESFCNGIHYSGPFFDHVLEYWTESQKMPEKILFLKYEELKRDPLAQVKRLASFLGRPDVNVEEVLRMCSFESLKNLEVDRHGEVPWIRYPYSSFFRLGVVGDSKNYLTPEMEERLNQISHDKFEGSGLNLDNDL